LDPKIETYPYLWDQLDAGRTLYKNPTNPWQIVLSIFEHLTDGIMILNRFKQIVGINKQMERLLGFTNEELAEKAIFCQLCAGIISEYNGEEEGTCIDCAIFDVNTQYFEMVMKTKSGRKIMVTGSSSLMPATKYTPPCTIITVRDISQQKERARKKIAQRLTLSMMRTLEEERKRVSRDLHDGIGQGIYSLQMGIKMLEQKVDDEQGKADIHALAQITAQLLDEVRAISSQLRPSILDDLGLVPAIRSYIRRYQQTNDIRVHFNFNRNVRVRAELEIALYRVLQECLTNAAKYAQTEDIDVDLKFYPDKVEMKVQDYGIGFDKGTLGQEGSGLGLFGMKERTRMLGGTLKVFTSPGEGTSIEVVLPITQEEG